MIQEFKRVRELGATYWLLGKRNLIEESQTPYAGGRRREEKRGLEGTASCGC